MTEILLFAVGCATFAVTTVATLLYGYLTLNRVWLDDHPRNRALLASGPEKKSLPENAPLTIAAPDQFP